MRRAKAVVSGTRGVVLAALLATPGLALAQEQRGSIEGRVSDAAGRPLAGLRVEAKGTALVGVASAMTDAAGHFALPALLPGRYEVSTAGDLGTARAEDVEVALGGVLTLNLTLGGEGAPAGSQPLPDLKQSASAVHIRGDRIGKLPNGRDFLSVAHRAAGANDEPSLAGLAIDGASAAEHRYFVDGLDTTNPMVGVSGQGVVVDFVDEVQVKSSGYAAEHGGGIGGVVSVVTRSGSEQWHGEVGAYFRSDALGGKPQRPHRPGPPHPAHQPHGQREGRAPDLPGRRLHADRTGIHPRRPPRPGSGVALRRLLAGPRDDRSDGHVSDERRDRELPPHGPDAVRRREPEPPARRGHARAARRGLQPLRAARTAARPRRDRQPGDRLRRARPPRAHLVLLPEPRPCRRPLPRPPSRRLLPHQPRGRGRAERGEVRLRDDEHRPGRRPSRPPAAAGLHQPPHELRDHPGRPVSHRPGPRRLLAAREPRLEGGGAVRPDRERRRRRRAGAGPHAALERVAHHDGRPARAGQLRLLPCPPGPGDGGRARHERGPFLPGRLVRHRPPDAEPGPARGA